MQVGSLSEEATPKFVSKSIVLTFHSNKEVECLYRLMNTEKIINTCYENGIHCLFILDELHNMYPDEPLLGKCFTIP